MKNLLIIFFLLACSLSYGQSTVYLRADTIKVMKQNGNANLQILNATRDTINGVLLNSGNGVTSFVRIRAINDSQFIVGTDTITIAGATGGNDPTAIIKNPTFGGYDILNFHTAVDSVIAKQFFEGTNITFDSTAFGITINSTASGENIYNTSDTIEADRHVEIYDKILTIGTPFAQFLIQGQEYAGELNVPSAIMFANYDTAFTQYASINAVSGVGTSTASLTTNHNTNIGGITLLSGATTTSYTLQITGASTAVSVLHTASTTDSKISNTFGINPSVYYLSNYAVDPADTPDSTAIIFPFRPSAQGDTVMAHDLITGQLYRTLASGTGGAGGSDTLYYANQGLTGVTLIHGSNDSIYINRLIAGSNVTLTKGTDSAITFAIAPGGIVNSIQFNDDGVFNGFAQLFYDPDTDKFWLSNTLRYPEGQSRYTVADSSSETGALTNSFHVHQYSTGDPLVGFSVGSSISSPTNTWLIGIDNSVSGDPFKISPSANMGSGTAQSMTLNSGGTGGYGTGTPNTLYKWTLEKNTASAGVISTPSLHHYSLATWDGAGSVAAGWGIQNDFAVENSTGTVKIIGSLGIIYSDPTNASEDAEFVLSSMRAGTMAEQFKLTSLGLPVFNSTVTAGGSTGDVTINKATGTANIAAAGTGVTITNSLVTANSIVYCVVRTNDGTAYIKNVVPTAGSFTVTLGAAATAEVSVGFIVFNN